MRPCKSVLPGQPWIKLLLHSHSQPTPTDWQCTVTVTVTVSPTLMIIFFHILGTLKKLSNNYSPFNQPGKHLFLIIFTSNENFLELSWISEDKKMLSLQMSTLKSNFQSCTWNYRINYDIRLNKLIHTDIFNSIKIHKQVQNKIYLRSL